MLWQLPGILADASTAVYGDFHVSVVLIVSGYVLGLLFFGTISVVLLTGYYRENQRILDRAYAVVGVLILLLLVSGVLLLFY